jgi:hypothetical protein
MPSPALSPEQEAEAQELATRIQQAVDAEVLRMARLVVSKAPRELFGQTEFDLRDIVLRLGATVYELYLAEKKTATTAPASPARTAAKAPISKATGPRRR